MNIYLIQPLKLLFSILQQTIINTNISPDPSLQLQEVVVRLDDPDVVSPVVPSLGPHHSLVNRIELLGSPLSDLHPLLRLLGGLHDSEEVVHVGLLRPHHSHVGTEAGGALLTIPLVAEMGAMRVSWMPQVIGRKYEILYVKPRLASRRVEHRGET